ncbi:MAG: TIGR00282 family metallophosphoesterase [Clostridiales bacterium]|jgi:metallophosphoesterase (TIGR00282 family)|nr:TIGR00282 family metallophosphoesterase [Clostridiales bacterium]
MNILAIGDVTGSIGCKFLRAHLPQLKKIKQVDLVIANGENSADGNGITPASAQFLFDSGVDVITAGNHSFRRREMYEVFDREETLLRPANFPPGTPGHGSCIVDKGRLQVGVINLMGVVYLESLDCPFAAADRLLKKMPAITLVDFHAEATGEKGALAYYLDGRVSAIFGTHTHVQTADESILPNGTGFITDVGMTGPIRSVLGVKPELVIQKMRSKMPVRFDLAGGDCHMDCVLFIIDDKTGKTTAVERLKIQ